MNKDKRETIRKNLKNLQYLNRLLSRLKGGDINELCERLQGAEIIQIEPTFTINSEDADGVILYVRGRKDSFHCVSFCIVPNGMGDYILNATSAEIRTR